MRASLLAWLDLATRRNLLLVKAPNAVGDWSKTVFDREVSRGQAMQLRVRQIAQVRLAALGSEEDVFLPPEDHCVRLAAPEKLLPLRVECNIRAVVVEQVELHSARVRTLHEPEVHLPVVWADQLRLRVTVLVHELDAVKLEERHQRRFCFRPTILPERVTEAIPCGSESFLVGIGVLQDQPLHPVWLSAEDPKSDRSAVVLHVVARAGEASLLQQTFDDL